MGSNPIALTNETNMLTAKHQTKHPLKSIRATIGATQQTAPPPRSS
jgi:hypothetical protein